MSFNNHDPGDPTGKKYGKTIQGQQENFTKHFVELDGVDKSFISSNEDEIDLFKKDLSESRLIQDMDQLKSSPLTSEDSSNTVSYEDIINGEAIIIYSKAVNKSLPGFIEWYKDFKK